MNADFPKDRPFIGLFRFQCVEGTLPAEVQVVRAIVTWNDGSTEAEPDRKKRFKRFPFRGDRIGYPAGSLLDWIPFAPPDAWHFA